MAIIFATGWEHGDALLNEPYMELLPGNSVSSTTAPTLTGTYSLVVRSRGINYILPTSDTELYVSVWVRRVSTLASELVRFTLADGTDITLETTGALVPIAVVNGSTVATSSGSALSINTWYHFQIRVLVNDSTGVIHIMQDGNTIINYSGDTQPGTAPNNIEKVGLISSGNFDNYFDDFVIRDDTWPGDCRIEGLVPNGDTATLDWTRSTGASNYLVVDERPANTTDYVSSIVSGDQDLYNVADWTGTNKSVQCLVAWNFAKADVASGQSIKQLVNSGATLSSSAAKVLSTDWLYYYYILENDPNTGLAWTDSAVDAVQIGQESVL